MSRRRLVVPPRVLDEGQPSVFALDLGSRIWLESTRANVDLPLFTASLLEDRRMRRKPRILEKVNAMQRFRALGREPM